MSVPMTLTKPQLEDVETLMTYLRDALSNFAINQDKDKPFDHDVLVAAMLNVLVQSIDLTYPKTASWILTNASYTLKLIAGMDRT